ncbi:hypothetical protein [Granulicella sp. WH15]|uniref:hypothetical protein n=1 Tax=Granulicella sp. WH15 TaxID=2602070 RepID=UPI0021083DA2|nr:hypothetical protein [Granulicella sp. WH15]
MTLMIGPAVPVPVSADVLNALTAVEVTNTTDGPSGFRLQFTLPKKSPLEVLFLVAGGASVPLVRVVVAVTLNGATEVLVDGVMTNHQYVPGSAGQGPTLTIIGEDLTRVMDYIDFSGIPYPAMPAEARVALILAKYAAFGVIPMVIPSVLIDVPIPIQQIPRQQGKDLAYVKQLAAEVGYVFYVEAGPTPGMSIAYWGPEIKVGTPQPALSYDMDVFSNVESLSFTYNAERKSLPVVLIQEPISKTIIPIPVPPITPLNPPLGAVMPIPKDIEFLDETSKYSPVRAALIGVAKASKTADVVTGSGTLDVLRYGRILKARKLVGVRGAGTAFDGLYYVRSVTHNLKRGSYTQSFSLGRNGLISTMGTVPA